MFRTLGSALAAPFRQWRAALKAAFLGGLPLWLWVIALIFAVNLSDDVLRQRLLDEDTTGGLVLFVIAALPFGWVLWWRALGGGGRFFGALLPSFFWLTLALLPTLLGLMLVGFYGLPAAIFLIPALLLSIALVLNLGSAFTRAVGTVPGPRPRWTQYIGFTMLYALVFLLLQVLVVFLTGIMFAIFAGGGAMTSVVVISTTIIMTLVFGYLMLVLAALSHALHKDEQDRIEEVF